MMRCGMDIVGDCVVHESYFRLLGQVLGEHKGRENVCQMLAYLSSYIKIGISSLTLYQ